jgi:2C-methyl-D-erythritol 2,4-cyclodiphosphate synthase
MIRKPKFMERIEMTQEELDAAIEIGEVIETDNSEKLRFVGKENGVPQWNML